jgi:hypothetical protein
MRISDACATRPQGIMQVGNREDIQLKAPCSAELPQQSLQRVRKRLRTDWLLLQQPCHRAHEDDRSPAGCPAPATRDSHNPCGDKSAWRCPRDADADGWEAEEQAGKEARERSVRPHAHTTHTGACASGPQTVWAGGSRCGGVAWIAHLAATPSQMMVK